MSANRVVIFDPSWNPAQDLQAQDRSFRFGQKRHVVVFRLLSAGSLDELVYSRQVYKQQLSNIAVSGKMEKRYFEGVQVKKPTCFSFRFSWNFVIGVQLLNTCISLNFRIFQDCKDFQGELFGICNLFRDLSDKLFTSEIFEMDEKQGQKEGHCHGTKQESIKIACVKEVGVTSLSVSETRTISDSEKALTCQPVLKDVGKYDF